MSNHLVDGPAPRLLHNSAFQPGATFAPRGIWPCLEIVLLVTTGEEGLLLGSTE